jgi:hypothetical protein
VACAASRSAVAARCSEEACARAQRRKAPNFKKRIVAGCENEGTTLC